MVDITRHLFRTLSKIIANNKKTKTYNKTTGIILMIRLSKRYP